MCNLDHGPTTRVPCLWPSLAMFQRLLVDWPYSLANFFHQKIGTPASLIPLSTSVRFVQSTAKSIRKMQFFLSLSSLITLVSATGVQNGREVRKPTDTHHKMDCYFEACTSDWTEVGRIVTPDLRKMARLAPYYARTNWPFLDVWTYCDWTGAMVVKKERNQCMDGNWRIGLWAEGCLNVQPNKYLNTQICGSYTDGDPYRVPSVPMHISKGMMSCPSPKSRWVLQPGESFEHLMWRRDQDSGCPRPNCRFSTCTSDPKEIAHIKLFPASRKQMGVNAFNPEVLDKYKDCEGPRIAELLDDQDPTNTCKHNNAMQLTWVGINCRSMCESYNDLRDPLLAKPYAYNQPLKSDGVWGNRLN